jgi:hypothetical protein
MGAASNLSFNQRRDFSLNGCASKQRFWSFARIGPWLPNAFSLSVLAWILSRSGKSLAELKNILPEFTALQLFLMFLQGDMF